MPVPIPPTPSTSTVPRAASDASDTAFPSPSRSPNSTSTSPRVVMVDERFLAPDSAEGVAVRIRGYTNHLSPVGQRYAREQLSRSDRCTPTTPTSGGRRGRVVVGTEADQYRETILRDDGDRTAGGEGGGGGGPILKVEALRDGKVLAVVHSRLTRAEVDQYDAFVLARRRPSRRRGEDDDDDDDDDDRAEGDRVTNRSDPAGGDDGGGDARSWWPRSSDRRETDRSEEDEDEDEDGDEDEREPVDGNFDDLPALVRAADAVPTPSGRRPVEGPDGGNDTSHRVRDMWRVATTEELMRETRRGTVARQRTTELVGR
ncbi:hypothetical protein JCM11491_001648 [Sporobolomyces phaffii]